MSVRYIASKKNRRLLTYNSYVYHKERETPDKVIWRCAEYIPNKCHGRLHTSSGMVVHGTDHNHGSDARKSVRKESIEKSKDTVNNTQRPAARSVEKTVTSLNIQSAAGQQPVLKECLKRNVQRKRKIEACVPPDPKSRIYLLIPEKYGQTTNGINSSSDRQHVHPDNIKRVSRTLKTQKTAAEYQKAYRARKMARLEGKLPLRPKPIIRKTPAEYQREYRARKKAGQEQFNASHANDDTNNSGITAPSCVVSSELYNSWNAHQP